MATTIGPRGHWTTRRGFIAAAGFGGVGLYGLWAAYGAAPGPLALLGLGHGGDTGVAGAGAHGAGQAVGHGAHGAHGASAASEAAGGVDAEAFRAETERFIARYRRADGSVHPRRMAMHDASAGRTGEDAGHGGHGDHAEHAGHAGQAERAGQAEHAHGSAVAMAMPPDDHGAPIEVPMITGRWYYLPAALRLDAGQDYRFRLLTMDVSHGASIQFGRGARMLRLRPGRVTEVDLRFERKGHHLVTCTVYCGAAHDVMRATIEVV